MTDSIYALEQKAADPSKRSVQARAEASTGFTPMSDVNGGAGVIWVTLGQRMDTEPHWNPIYPNWRDRFLLNFSQSESMAAAAIYSMKTRIGTLNYEFNGPPRAKKFGQELLNKPGLGDTLPTIVQKLSSDLDTSDNGAFLELWKAGDPAKAPPRNAPCVGFAHLDSRLCWRSFDPDFPVWYTNPITGEIRKLHKERVVFVADNPQPVELARGIGFCALSRALRMVRVFRSMQIFVDEKVQGRFTRAIGAISGVSAGQVKRALEQHDKNADNKGYVIYNDIPFLIDPSTEGKNDIKILLQDLASIPDGFSFRDDADLYAYILAFCFGVDAREFWPATQSGATKADATVQNMKARGRGIGNRIQTIEMMLRQALPESCTFEYDFTDDEQDETQARIHNLKIRNLSQVLRDGAINNLEYRALAIAEGLIDGELLETLSLPMTSDSAADSEDESAGIQPNSENSADPGDGNTTTAVNGQTPVAANKQVISQADKSEGNYRRSLRAAVRGYWSGTLGAFDFFDSMISAIERNLTMAWYDGMKDYGLQPADITQEERTRLTFEINTQISYINGLASAVSTNSKANGGALFPLYDRLELWVKVYGRIQSLAGMLAAADEKAQWEYGDTIKHCPSCAAYAGRVYRNSVWRKWLEPYDLLPRGKGLACGGWQCDCRFKKTSEPVSSGHPPIVTKESHNHGKSIPAERHHTQTYPDHQGLHSGHGNGSGSGRQPDFARSEIDHAHLEA